MPFDTRDRRAAVLGLDLHWCHVYPNPAGSLATQEKRQQMALVYTGILAGTQQSFTATDTFHFTDTVSARTVEGDDTATLTEAVIIGVIPTDLIVLTETTKIGLSSTDTFTDSTEAISIGLSFSDTGTIADTISARSMLVLENFTETDQGVLTTDVAQNVFAFDTFRAIDVALLLVPPNRMIGPIMVDGRQETKQVT